MRRYFTAIITACVVSSPLHSYSGFDPCVGGLFFRVAEIPVLPLNIISPPTCHCLLFVFPNQLGGKKAVPRDCIWEKMYHRESFGQPKNMLSPKIHCRMVTWFKPLFISEEKAWFLTGINQESSVNLHWSVLELAQVTATCAEQNHFITENQI